MPAFAGMTKLLLRLKAQGDITRESRIIYEAQAGSCGFEDENRMRDCTKEGSSRLILAIFNV
jgi:hypothetical protein